jgi:hypothetical protein
MFESLHRAPRSLTPAPTSFVPITDESRTEHRRGTHGLPSELLVRGGNSLFCRRDSCQVGLEWTVAGFGGFSGKANETDMLMRDSNNGAFEVYDISNNALMSAAAIGAVGLEWTVAGFGDFSGNGNESDMLMRNSNTGAFEVYDISHNAITSAASMGQVGLLWQVGGIAADPPPASPAASTSLFVQAMASFGARATVTSAPGAVLGGVDTPQHTLLTIPH